MGAATLLQPKRRGRCSPLRHGLAAQKQSRSALNIDFQQIVNASEYLDSSFDLVAERSGKQFQYEVSLSLVNDRQKIQGRASVLSPIAQSKRQQLSMTYNLKRSPDSVPDRDQSLKDTWFEAKGQLVLPSGLLEAGGMTLDVSRGHWWGYEVAGDDQPAGEGVLHATVHLMDSPFEKRQFCILAY